MNKGDLVTKKKSIQLLNDLYVKIMTNFNNLSESMIDYQSYFDRQNLNSNYILRNLVKKEKFLKILLLTNETKGYFQNFYSNFSTILKVIVKINL